MKTTKKNIDMRAAPESRLFTSVINNDLFWSVLFVYPFRYEPHKVQIPGNCTLSTTGAGFCYALVRNDDQIMAT